MDFAGGESRFFQDGSRSWRMRKKWISLGENGGFGETLGVPGGPLGRGRSNKKEARREKEDATRQKQEERRKHQHERKTKTRSIYTNSRSTASGGPILCSK